LDISGPSQQGEAAHLNFPVEDYLADMHDINTLPTAALIAQLRRKSSGFSRGASKFRGASNSTRTSSITYEIVLHAMM
jgi:AP2-like factor (ANT lineage)